MTAHTSGKTGDCHFPIWEYEPRTRLLLSLVVVVCAADAWETTRAANVVDPTTASFDNLYELYDTQASYAHVAARSGRANSSA